MALANGRCDQENVLEQLKNGVHAMRLPVADLVSNGASMVLAALAWNRKAWYGLLVPAKTPREIIVRLNAELMKILQRPDVKARFDAEGIEALGGTRYKTYRIYEWE